VRRTLAPLVIKGHLEGDTRSLKPWLTEGVFSRLSAEIRARKKDGIVIDSNILDIDENTVMLRFLETGEAAILVIYMVQQINCIRNTAGEVIEVLRNVLCLAVVHTSTPFFLFGLCCVILAI
jgi:predicted lipid-binding transport protein (Tim44 family)